MKQGQRLWTREELILTINLYCKLPFGKLHYRNPEIIALSNLINRTASSVALKLVNFASLDPSLKARGIKGAQNASKLDSQIWNEFYDNWEDLAFESEELLAKKQNKSVEFLNKYDENEILVKGKEREQIVKKRVNQTFFRKLILASYNNTCCITGIQNSDLIIAGHIKPWSDDKLNRLNPRNGLAMNPLHDKAFESGLITINPDYKILISSVLKKDSNNAINELFIKYDMREIILPSRFLPDIELLKYHNNERFIQ